jgi:hypothetical protein
MKPRNWMFLSLAAAAVLAGCGRNHNASVEFAQDEAVPLFQGNKGIWLPDETRKLFGVEVAEVAEQPMQQELRKLARVYREARDGAPAGASAMLTTAEMKDLKPGHAIRLKAAGSQEEVPGKLARVDEQTQSALGQAEALVEFDDAQQRVTVGAFLTATFLIGEPRSVLVVSKTALLTAAEGTFVYAVNGKHFTRTKIKTGATTEGFVEVEDGLYSGDQVVAKGVESLWLIEWNALKGGKPCCVVAKRETPSAR